MMTPVDREKYMDADEVNRLITVTEARAIVDLKAGRVSGVLAWMVIDTALSTGLRVSEMARLTVGDVDLKRNALKVWRHKRKPHRRETMAISPEYTAHLKEFIEWKKLVGQTTGKAAPLFVGKRGPLTEYGLQQIWKRAVELTGLPKELSIHSARHTVAVHLLKKTGNLRQVQKQLGHASPATTANMYADVTFDDMREGMARLYRATEK